MPAPVVADFQISPWAGTSTSEVTPTVTWQANDFIVVVGVTEDSGGATLNTPTATGLTFSLILSSLVANNCAIYLWSATAAASGAQAITATSDGTSKNRGIAAYVYRGSTGAGNTATISDSSTTNTVISLIRGTANSAVVVIMGDWSAVNDVAVTANPSSGGTVRGIVNNAGAATFYSASWTDAGVPATTSYGIGSYTATPTWAGIVVEVKGLPAILSKPVPFNLLLHYRKTRLFPY